MARSEENRLNKDRRFIGNEGRVPVGPKCPLRKYHSRNVQAMLCFIFSGVAAKLARSRARESQLNQNRYYARVAARIDHRVNLMGAAGRLIFMSRVLSVTDLRKS